MTEHEHTYDNHIIILYKKIIDWMWKTYVMPIHKIL